MHFDSSNVGITVQSAPGAFIGQSWIRNILMEGLFKTAGIDIFNGGGAARLEHVRMFNGTMNPTDPQPKYGVLVRSAGELFMDACDLDNCGTNLAIVPGIDGQANTFVQNLSIVNSDFDNGNGEGQILIRPYGSSFVLNTEIDNGWFSTVDNGGGTWPANGLTIDGTHSHTALGFPCIDNVDLSNSVFQNHKQHCGVYAIAANGLSIVGCTAGANYVGFQTYGCIGLLDDCKAGAYVAGGGNTTYGVLLEKSGMQFDPKMNSLAGNGVAPGHN